MSELLIGIAIGLFVGLIVGWFNTGYIWKNAYDLGLQHGLDGTVDAARKRAVRGQ